MTKEQVLTYEKLSQMYSYDPDNGIITSKRTNKTIGSLGKKGYLVTTVFVDYKTYFVLLHRLAYLLHHGEWPTNTINHINEIKTDNRIINLEDVTLLENIKYSAGRSNTGEPYIYKNNNSYSIYLTKNGIQQYIGTFKSLKKAKKVRNNILQLIQL